MSGIIAIMKEVQEALLPSSTMGGCDGRIAASEEHGFTRQIQCPRSAP